MTRCYVCLQWRRRFQFPRHTGCACSIEAHAACVVAHATATRSLECPVCKRPISRALQRKCANAIVDQLYNDLAELPPEAYRRRAKLLRRITDLLHIARNPTKAVETNQLAEREAYFSCVAMALARAEDTLDPRDVLLIAHLIAGIDPSHVLVRWAHQIFFASRC